MRLFTIPPNGRAQGLEMDQFTRRSLNTVLVAFASLSVVMAFRASGHDIRNSPVIYSFLVLATFKFLSIAANEIYIARNNAPRIANP